MPTYEQYLKELKKSQKQLGFKHKLITVLSHKGELKIDLYGPSIFLEKMPPLIEAIVKAPYNAALFSALAVAKKPLSLIHMKDRSLLSAGAIREDLPWYKFLSVQKVREMAIYFNVEGYVKPISVECRQGNKVLSFKKRDDLKFTLVHEFFHLWNEIEPQRIPKKGYLPRYMSSPKLQSELWATRYTNGWRYKETRCVRRLYGRMNYVVDSVSNYR